MKTIWGSLLIAFVLGNSQLALAESWTPFIGASVLPNINSVYTKYDATPNHEERRELIGTTNGSFIVKAGLEKDHWSILFHYYMTSMLSPWADMTDSTANTYGWHTVDTYELREWREIHIACGARYSPRLPVNAKSKLYVGGGIGFGQVDYRDRYSSVEVDGSVRTTRSKKEIKAESPYFFKQYGEIGVSTKLSSSFNMSLGFTLQHAMVALDQKKLNPYIHNNVENWVVALEIGFQYYFRQN